MYFDASFQELVLPKIFDILCIGLIQETSFFVGEIANRIGYKQFISLFKLLFKKYQHVRPMNGETPDKKNSLTCKKQIRLIRKVFTRVLN